MVSQSRMAIAPPEFAGPLRYRTAAAPARRRRRLFRPLVPSVPLLVAVGAGVTTLAVFPLVSGALVDDAYITLTYARNLAFHAHWGVNLDGVAHTATSPLNVLLLAAVAAVVRQPVVAAGVVFALCVAATGWWAARTASVRSWPVWTGPVAAAVVLVNPLLLSTVGLETHLAVALLVGLCWAATVGRPGAAGVLGGLLVLTRPDLAVVVVAATAAVPALMRRAQVVFAAAVATALPWFVLAWILLGSAVPDTMLWKVGADWGGTTVLNGLGLYLRVFPVATPLALIGPVAGAVAGVLWVFAQGVRAVPALVLGAGSAAHLLVFCLLGTAPYHWYYGPAVGALSVLVVFALAAVSGWAWAHAPEIAPVVVRAGCGAVVLLVLLSAGYAGHDGARWRIAPISTNHATSEEYARVAGGLHGKVVSAGEVGALAYFCEDRCAIDDPLSERAALLGRVRDRIDRSGPVLGALLRVNYLFVRPARYTPGTSTLVMRRGTFPDGVDVATPWSGAGNLVVLPR